MRLPCLVLGTVVALCLSSVAAQAPEPFTIRALLLDSKGNPIPGETVYCLVYQDGQSFYQMALVDDRLVPAGPRGKSDASGKLEITVDAQFIAKGAKEFTLGSVRDGKVVNLLKQGKPFVFALEDARKAKNNLHVGLVILKLD